MKASKRRLAVPSGLSAESRRLFGKLTKEYAIADAGGVEILRSGLLSLDQAMRAEASIAADGQTFKDRWGQLRPHPLLAAARDHRAAWLNALKSLNLAIGDPTTPGRPEGS